MHIDGGAGEIADVGAELSRIERRQHGGLIDHAFARKIQQHRARAHQADVGLTDRVARGVEQRHVQRHEMGGLEHLGHAAGLAHLRRQAPGGLDRDVRVVAQHVHAELDGGVGDQAADLAEADHAERVTCQLDAGVALLAGLDLPVHVGRRRVERGHEAQRGHQVARRHQHAGQHQFLDGVGVGARRVEDRHTARAHGGHRDVVGAGTSARNGPHAVGQLHRMHVGRAHQHRAGLGQVVADVVAVGRQPRQTARRDLVQYQHVEATGRRLIHGRPRTRACRPPAPARPRSAWRCRSTPACRPPSGGP